MHALLCFTCFYCHCCIQLGNFVRYKLLFTQDWDTCTQIQRYLLVFALGTPAGCYLLRFPFNNKFWHSLCYVIISLFISQSLYRIKTSVCWFWESIFRVFLFLFDSFFDRLSSGTSKSFKLTFIVSTSVVKTDFSKSYSVIYIVKAKWGFLSCNVLLVFLMSNFKMTLEANQSVTNPTHCGQMFFSKTFNIIMKSFLKIKAWYF